MAEIVSPPPIIDISEFILVLEEIFFAIDTVPFEKFLFSK